MQYGSTTVWCKRIVFAMNASEKDVLFTAKYITLVRLLTFGLFQIDFDQRMTQLDRTLKRKVSLICTQLVFGCSTGQYKTWTADCGLRTADWV